MSFFLVDGCSLLTTAEESSWRHC